MVHIKEYIVLTVIYDSYSILSRRDFGENKRKAEDYAVACKEKGTNICIHILEITDKHDGKGQWLSGIRTRYALEFHGPLVKAAEEEQER